MLQGRFGQVETILRPLDARSSSVAGLLLESRLKRLAGHPLPSPQTVHDWLASSPAALQPRYAEAVLDTLARQDRSADAGRYLAPWLKELAQHDPATARQMQARLAQGRQDWPAAIAQWQALAQQRPLTPAETLDYGYALLAAGEADELALVAEGTAGRGQAGRKHAVHMPVPGQRPGAEFAIAVAHGSARVLK